MSINLRRLRAFVTVAATRSVTEAARELHMSPPAVTKSVRELERALAAPLFQRTASGMQLTAVGEAFRLHAERALGAVEQGREEVASLLGGTGGRVAVGATPEAANLVLPMALGRLIKRNASIDVSMRGGTFEELARDTRAGVLDFFVAVLPPEGAPAGLTAEPLYEDELILVAGPRHPFTRRSRLEPSELAKSRWIDATGDGALQQMMRRSLADAGLEPPAGAVVVQQLGAMRAVLQETELVAVVTRMRVRVELEAGLLAVLPVPLPYTRHQVAAFQREPVYLSPWCRELLVLTRRVAAEFGTPTA